MHLHGRVCSLDGELGKITNVVGEEDRYYDDTLVARKLTDASVKFIKDNKDNLIFLYLSHWEVHGRIVIFASDNGGISNNTSNKPLRAGKGTFYEGGIRTPCCIKWPGIIKAGSISEEPVIGIDFMPTFAELANAPLPDTQSIDGKSIVPILKGENFNPSRAIFFHFPLYLGSGGMDKVLPSYNGISNYWRAVPLSVIIKDNWKLIYYYEYEKI